MKPLKAYTKKREENSNGGKLTSFRERERGRLLTGKVEEEIRAFHGRWISVLGLSIVRWKHEGLGLLDGLLNLVGLFAITTRDRYLFCSFLELLTCLSITVSRKYFILAITNVIVLYKYIYVWLTKLVKFYLKQGRLTHKRSPGPSLSLSYNNN